MGTKKTLAEFGQTWKPHPSGNAAWLDSLPEFPQILEAWQAGTSADMIRAWLIEECGYTPEEATRNRVYNRLRDRYRR